MESKYELKEIDIKNRACYYFHDVISGIKIFQFMTFCIKLQQVQNHCILGSTK